MKNYFSISKIQYIRRVLPAHNNGEALHEFDQLIRSTLGQITNVRLKEKSWSQASPPVRLGGLGLRRTVNVSLLAFFSSVHASTSLLDILTSRVNGLAAATELDEAGTLRDKLSGGTEDPTAKSSLKQRSWDEPICKAKIETLLERSNQVERARLLAADEFESGMWLQAIPVPSLRYWHT